MLSDKNGTLELNDYHLLKKQRIIFPFLTVLFSGPDNKLSKEMHKNLIYTVFSLSFKYFSSSGSTQ